MVGIDARLELAGAAEVICGRTLGARTDRRGFRHSTVSHAFTQFGGQSFGRFTPGRQIES